MVASSSGGSLEGADFFGGFGFSLVAAGWLVVLAVFAPDFFVFFWGCMEVLISHSLYDSKFFFGYRLPEPQIRPVRRCRRSHYPHPSF